LRRIGINWTVGVPSGWGTFGLNLGVALARRGDHPVPLSVHEPLDLIDEHRAALEPCLAAHRAALPHLEANAGRPLAFPVLQPLGDALSFPPRVDRHPGRPDIGVVFFEHVDIPAANLARAASWPLIVAGSSWNAEVLSELGLGNVVFCPQGIDPALFHPRPRQGAFGDKFVIFSAGKFEYRKGQDIVTAAFRAFRQRHADALLVCAWANLWPDLVGGLAASPHVRGVPRVGANGVLELAPWLIDNGIPPDSVVDLGLLRNSAMPKVLAECDLAVFPNRCEGGTNLAAMEAMACGVPAVLSANTGHLDLLGAHARTLERQGSVAATTGDGGKRGWGESDVDEVLDAMEWAYRHRDEAKAMGAAGAGFMRDWSWARQTERLLGALDAALGRR
jgi:glycosyltransferase involved in cell wall biosynthesis